MLAYLDWNEHSCSPFEHFGLCDETNHIPVGLECTMSAALNGIEVAFEFSTDMPRQLIVVHQLFQTRRLPLLPGTLHILCTSTLCRAMK